MRITVIRDDNAVYIDGVCKTGIDMSSIPPHVNAMQWYDTYGDEESTDPETGRPVNTIITSLDDYQGVISQWENK